MTEIEKELQELRRENANLRIENMKLKVNNDSLETLHMLDQSELARLRRWIEALVEKEDG